MELTLNNLKKNFTDIMDIRREIVAITDVLKSKIHILKEIYTEFIKNNKSHMFMFGLDSFRFQSKMIDIEYEDLKRLFSAINNRMYCEYYKLYKLIIDYIKESITEPKVLEIIKMDNHFPQYKDLEPYKQYDFEFIQDIHENIVLILTSLNGYLSSKEHELKVHKVKNDSGLNIDNFITAFNFNNVMLREKIMMFVGYIEFFHKLHTKYLKRYVTKAQLMFSQIKSDIKFDDASSHTSKPKKSVLIKNAQKEKQVIEDNTNYDSDNVSESMNTQLQLDLADDDKSVTSISTTFKNGFSDTISGIVNSPQMAINMFKAGSKKIVDVFVSTNAKDNLKKPSPHPIEKIEVERKVVREESIIANINILENELKEEWENERTSDKESVEVLEETSNQITELDMVQTEEEVEVEVEVEDVDSSLSSEIENNNVEEELKPDTLDNNSEIMTEVFNVLDYIKSNINSKQERMFNDIIEPTDDLSSMTNEVLDPDDINNVFNEPMEIPYEAPVFHKKKHRNKNH